MPDITFTSCGHTYPASQARLPINIPYASLSTAARPSPSSIPTLCYTCALISRRDNETLILENHNANIREKRGRILMARERQERAWDWTKEMAEAIREAERAVVEMERRRDSGEVVQEVWRTWRERWGDWVAVQRGGGGRWEVVGSTVR